MSLIIKKSGIFTIVQDLGRWGYQSRGVHVSAPMDQFSLRIGNVMLGNDENDAALEMLLTGFDAIFQMDCCVVLSFGNH